MSRAIRVLLLSACTCLVFLPAASAGAPKTLDIYFIDVEGGQATLIVSPSGASMLIDTGWLGYKGRDADRIVAAAKAAGLQQIDTVVITHYHRDHVGGAAQLAGRIKIGTFVDHGPNREDSANTRKDYAAYEQVAATARRVVVKPGEQIPLPGIAVEVLTAGGERIRKALPGAGRPNPLCASEREAPADATENARSLGVLLTYGQFRFLDLGDLTRDKELPLFCPDNLIGTVDLYLATHHGHAENNRPFVVDALRPRVAIVDNGAHKGGSPKAWQVMHDSPGMEGIWQLHYALDADKEHNSPDVFIANLAENCDGKYIKVSARPDGSFTVVNLRNEYEKTYSK